MGIPRRRRRRICCRRARRPWGVTVEELYGGSAPKRRLAKHEGDSRLCRRLRAIEKLDANEKRQVLQLIDAFMARGQPRSKLSEGR